MAYLNESHIEDADIAFFSELGYAHINAWKDELLGRKSLKEVVLRDKLESALVTINPTLPLIAIHDALDMLTKSRASQGELESNMELYHLIKDGVPVTFTNDEAKEEVTKVKVIDFENSSNNDFLIVSQLTIEYRDSNAKRRPDLILYVNGLPLIMIELKNATIKVKQGYDKNLQDYRQDIPQLFYYNLFIIISNGIQTRVGSFNAPWEHFFTWSKLEDNVKNHDQQTLLQVEQQSKDEKSRLSLKIVTEGLCSKDKLIDYCENFVLYHRNKVKIIAKNHQFLGVNVAIDSFNKRDGSGKLGVFWHTQGSGKSYSMIFFSKKINRRIEGNWSFLILTDRNDLDDQIFRNFLDTKTFEISSSEQQTKNQYRAKGTSSRKQLEEALSKNKSYFFSTIFNFAVAKGKTYTQKSDRNNWIVIIDEAHRSQYKGYGENIKIALPNAQFIAFTGTPILKSGLTEQWFGSYISEYNFAQSIEDGATVPLYYRKSVPSVEQVNEELVGDAAEILDSHDLNEEQQQKLDREYSTLFEVVKRDDRLDEVAKHIVKHFPSRLDVINEEGDRKPMKAMVVSIDKFTALRMHDKVQHFLKEELKELRKEKSRCRDSEQKEIISRKIDFINETKMAVVISQEGGDRQEREKFAEVGLDITPHRKLMDSPDEDGRDIEDYFKDPNNPYRVVFVTAMWMTGFDAPSVSTLYLDKPMKNHTLMQTIARANRVYEGKKNGLIIDYFGVFRSLKKALSDYAEGSSGTSSPLDMPVKEFGELLKLLEQGIKECKMYLNDFDVDVERIHALGEKGFKEVVLFQDFADTILENDDRRKRFNLFVNTISSLYDSAKPEVYEYPHIKKERDLFLYLKDIVNRKLDRDEEIQKARKEVDDLLDSSVLGKGDLDDGKVNITDYKEINLGKLNFEKLREEFPKKEHKNMSFTDLKEFMELKLKQMMARNKTRGSFLENFERVIDEYNNGSIEIEEAYEKLLREAQRLSDEENRALSMGLSEEELEIFDLLKKDKLTKDDEKEVRKASVLLLKKLEDKKHELFMYKWYKEKQKKERVQDEIKKVLDQALPASYKKDIFMKKNEEIFAHIYHLAEVGNSRYLSA